MKTCCIEFFSNQIFISSLFPLKIKAPQLYCQYLHDDHIILVENSTINGHCNIVLFDKKIIDLIHWVIELQCLEY